MKVWHLTLRRHAALDGAGARLYGGRWNRRGQAVVYTSLHLSLAALEIIVHLELGIAEFPADYVKIPIGVPDDLSITRVRKPPRTEEEALKTGAAWLEAKVTAGLLVPSIVVPEEHNLLLNPAHEDFAKVKAFPPRPFGFDPWLLGQTGSR